MRQHQIQFLITSSECRRPRHDADVRTCLRQIPSWRGLSQLCTICLPSNSRKNDLNVIRARRECDTSDLTATSHDYGMYGYVIGRRKLVHSSPFRQILRSTWYRIGHISKTVFDWLFHFERRSRLSSVFLTSVSLTTLQRRSESDWTSNISISFWMVVCIWSFLFVRS